MQELGRWEVCQGAQRECTGVYERTRQVGGVPRSTNESAQGCMKEVGRREVCQGAQMRVHRGV